MQDVCEAGGKNFQAIFGARTPLIESFLIKRKLMGPCWVTVRNPKVRNLLPALIPTLVNDFVKLILILISNIDF